MNERLKYWARRALAGVIVCAYGLIVLPAPLLAFDPKSTFCNALEVTVWALENRFHIKCEEAGAGNIQYFAFSLNNSNTDRLISLASTAVVTHHKLFISYDLDDHSLEPGCQRGNCRPIQVLYLLN
jgi:hypothetical protein